MTGTVTGGETRAMARESTIMTVLGPIPVGELGVTLTHKHCLVDLAPWFSPPPGSEGADLDGPVEPSISRRSTPSMTPDDPTTGLVFVPRTLS